MPKKIFLVAGEASGDLHAGALCRELKKREPALELYGLGGERMQEAGVHLYFPLAKLAVVGFSEVLRYLHLFKNLLHKTQQWISALRPDCVILVDYPGFNLHLAQKIRKLGIPIYYYISPQVWAWGRKRLRVMKTLIDHMVVILPFEEELYKKEGIPVTFIGHPLLDLIKPLRQAPYKQRPSPDHYTISLLPGSREKEVCRILPMMLETAEIIHRKIPKTQFLLLKAPGIKAQIIEKIIKNKNLPLEIRENATYESLVSSHLALVASGTATLESAILNIPMVIVYKVSMLTYLMAKNMVRIPYIGLVNVVAGKKVVPEFVQYQARPKSIAKEALSLLQDSERLCGIRQELNKVKDRLGNPGAISRGAEVILKLLSYPTPAS